MKYSFTCQQIRGSSYPLSISRIRTVPNRPLRVALPAGAGRTTPARTAEADWTFWQFSNEGSVTGVEVGVDLTRLNGSPKTFEAFVGGKTERR